LVSGIIEAGFCFLAAAETGSFPLVAHSLLRQVVGLLRIAVTCKIEIASARKKTELWPARAIMVSLVISAIEG
jgi:hypothetical protein